jgi:hypothetical protein
VQVHEDQQITNTMETRTTGAISLGPSNMNGGYKFFSIVTGEILVQRKWVELPIPNEVILKLEEFSTDGSDDINAILVEDVDEEEEIPIMEDMGFEQENPPTVLENEDTNGDKIEDNIIEEAV